MKTLYKLFNKLGWIVFLLLIAFVGKAENGELKDVYYDQCQGVVSMTFKFQNEAWCGVRCLDGTVHYDRSLEGSDNYVYFDVEGTRVNILRVQDGKNRSGNTWSFDGGCDKNGGVSLFRYSDNLYEATQNSVGGGPNISGCASNKHVSWATVRYHIPREYYGKILNFGMSGRYDGNNFNNTGFIVNVPALPQPQGLNTTPLCNAVRLSWTKPNFACSNVKYQIFRNGNLIIDDLDFDNTSYTDNVGASYITNNYLIRTKFTHIYGNVYYSNDVNASGAPVQLPGTISGFRVIQGKCTPNQNPVETEISNTISWSFSGQNRPNQFTIQRSTNPWFWPTPEKEYSITDNRYEDIDDLRFNTTYYYRVLSQNTTCSTSVTSETKTVVINGVPDMPSLVTTSVAGISAVMVRWAHPGTKINGYLIERTDVKSGIAVTNESNNPNQKSFLDENIPNCTQYTYRIKAKSECFSPVSSTVVSNMNFRDNRIKSVIKPNKLNASKGYFPDKVKLVWEYESSNEVENFVILRRPLGSTGNFNIFDRVAAPNTTWEDFSGTAGQLYEYGIQAETRCNDTTFYSNSHPSISEDYRSVGFRNPTALVNGKITYNGGIALEGAKVVAAKAENSKLGTSYQFDGNTRIEIADTANPNTNSWFPTSNFALSFWLKPTGTTTGMTVLSKNGTGANPNHLVQVSAFGSKQDTNFVFAADTIRWMTKGGIVAKKHQNLLFSPDSGSIIGVFENDSLKWIEKTFQTALLKGDTLYDSNDNVVKGIVGRDILYGKDTIYTPAIKSVSYPVRAALYGSLKNDTIFSADKDSIYAFIKNDTLFQARYGLKLTQKGSIYGSVATVSGKVTIFPVDNPTTKRYIFGTSITGSSNGTGTVLAFIIKDTLYHANYGLGTVPRIGEKFAVREGNTIYHLVPSSEIVISIGEAYGKRSNDTVYALSGQKNAIYLIQNSENVYSTNYRTDNSLVKGNTSAWLEKNTIFSISRDAITSVVENNKIYTFDLENKGRLIVDTVKSPQNKSLYVLENGSRLFEMLHFQTVNSVKSITGISPRNLYTLRYSSYLNYITRTVEADSLLMDEFTNIIITNDGKKLKIYANAILKDSIAFTGGLETESNPIVLGARNIAGAYTNHFSGYIDEVLVWNTTLTSNQIKQNYGRYLIGNETGIAAYWRIDENAGSRIYDASRDDKIADENTRYNRHQGRIIGNIRWSSQAPDPEILGFAGYTDSKGDYSIPAIRYNGTGENFKIVPIFKTHEFDPSNTVLFLGEGSVVQNNINFIDKSSFKVTGFVRLDTTGYGPNTCFIENVMIKIDGKPVIQNAKLVTTDSKGKFEIRVPIGEHFISVEKEGNTFSLGKWPVNTETHNFQEDISGITFRNNTKRIIVGKVVGGKEEGDKFSGFGKSKNNLGVAKIEYMALGNECMNKTVYTNATTGEYVITLPALQFRVNNLGIGSASAGMNKELKSLADEIVDLSVRFDKDPFEASDTTYHVQNGGKSAANIKSIKKVIYHKMKDYIYQTTPKIIVTSIDSSEFNGDRVLTYSSPSGAFTTTVPGYTKVGKNIEYTFGLPVFTSGIDYTMRIALKEAYTNTDKSITGEYFVKDAAIEFTNNIADYRAKLSLPNGDTTITFKAGKPNLLQSAQYSFTKTIDILGTKGARWEPNSGSQIIDKIFRGYVLGSQLKENLDFITDIDDPLKTVDFILRDPPGNKSKTVLKKGTKVVKKSSSSFGLSMNQKVVVTAGIDLEVYEVVATGMKLVDQEGTTGLEISGKEKASGGFEFGWSQSFATDISTNGDAYRPGAPSDLFVGTGINVLYGQSDKFHLIPTSICGVNSVVCVATATSGFSLGKKESYTIVPQKDFSTQFFYTAEHIENEINGLHRKRNSLFDGEIYESRLPVNHPLYGVNNDDVRLAQFGLSITGSIGTQTDEGSSYVYRRGLVTTTGAIDRIRKNNTQISLWKQVLAMNEKEKVESIRVLETLNLASSLTGIDLTKANSDPGIKPYQNYSFGYGASVTQSSTSENSTGGFFEFEFELGLAHKTELGGSSAGIKYETKYEFGGAFSAGTKYEEENAEETTWEYTLEDDDINDQISVDVFKSNTGNGPVFVTKAGRTSCPHEPQYITKYYEPGFVISGGTIQRDQPKIRVTPNVLTNIDPMGTGIFMVELGNENREDSVRNYIVRYDTRTNLGGANIRLDGKSLALKYDIAIPGGQSFTMPLVVSRGPLDYNYDNIKIIMYSPCQFSFGQSFEKSIYDSTSISIHFLPTCTNPSIDAPNTRWILNNSFKDTLDLTLGGYDINFPGLRDVRFQFKKTSQSDADWLTWNTFWKAEHPDKPTDPSTDSIPTTRGDIDYAWVVSQLTDGDYDLRMQSTCIVKESPDPVRVVSALISGTIDRVNPHPFGTPSPADGILSPNDDIYIQFNEDIDAGKLTWDNFEVKGVLNGTELRHDASVYFDGTKEKYARINGFWLQNQSFTVEFWAKRKATGEEIVLAQGAVGTPEMYIGFDANNKFKFSLNGKVLLSDEAISDDKWHHLTVSYDYDLNRAYMYGDGKLLASNTNFMADYRGSGYIYLGKRNFAPHLPFKGHLHELRIWKKSLPLTDIAINIGKKMSGREIGLAGCWPLDEATGTLSQDVVNRKNAEIHAEWTVEPASKSILLAGSGYIEAKSAKAAFTKEMDFTIEFWFKSATAGAYTLLSNGKGDLTDSSKTDWAISSLQNGKIVVENNGKTFTAVDSNFFDNQWHHFSLVVNRAGSTNAYVDGLLQNTSSREGWSGFGGANIWMGAKGWYIGNTKNTAAYFYGQLDEVRIWGMARKQEQIKNDKNNRLKGDEFGLIAYYPFEAYQEDAAGIMLLETTLKNQEKSAKDTAVAISATYSDETPKIKLPRPVEKVNFILKISIGFHILPTEIG